MSLDPSTDDVPNLSGHVTPSSIKISGGDSIDSRKQNKSDMPSSDVVKSDGRVKLRSWLNKQMRIEMSDGRVLVGIFLCTDRDGNVILGSCTEYINPEAWGFVDEPRMLGLVMVPGKHIVTVHHDTDTIPSEGISSDGCSTLDKRSLTPVLNDELKVTKQIL